MSTGNDTGLARGTKGQMHQEETVMGKRANIRATRYAAEAAELELRRQTQIAEEMRRAAMTDDERIADDKAIAARAAAEAAAQAQGNRDAAKLVGAVIASVIVGSIAGWIGLLFFWAAVGAAILIRKHKKSVAEAEARAKAEADERARIADEAARSAQVEHHVRMLCAADPTFVALTEEWKRIPPTRPDARARNEAQQAERLVIIDQYAATFAELERSGQPVPDHGATMRDLVAAEQAWDTRSP
ncbi:hypothetical protein [Pseudonocardia sp. NPDC049635]|uniref:hypothetical protein n=1 Tax=Pseudonocardia sp. NPDC049635 TaxID=3155506 RepID=UPI0033F3C751